MLQKASQHQSLVGQSFLRDRCKYLCLAAHEDAILLLEYGVSGQPSNYIVCHRPYVEADVLHWAAGDYFTIPNYQSAGRQNPMSAAFADAVDCLLSSCVISFSFEAVEETDEAATLSLQVYPALDDEQMAEIEDALAAYVDSVSAYTYEQCVEEVMRSFPQYHYKVLKPDRSLSV